MAERINKIKEILVREGVTQKELAEALEKNEHTVSNWCINKSQHHLKDLLAIAQYLNIDIRDLLVSNKGEK